MVACEPQLQHGRHRQFQVVQARSRCQEYRSARKAVGRHAPITTCPRVSSLPFSPVCVCWRKAPVVTRLGPSTYAIVTPGSLASGRHLSALTQHNPRSQMQDKASRGPRRGQIEYQAPTPLPMPASLGCPSCSNAQPVASPLAAAFVPCSCGAVHPSLITLVQYKWFTDIYNVLDRHQ